MSTLIKDLSDRGLIFQQTDEKLLLESCSGNKKITVYVGFDPTARSLTVGNLATVLLLKRFQKAGHKVIALVGGATGLVGDPSGRNAERQLNSQEVVSSWVDNITSQLKPFLSFEGDNPAIIVNNLQWYKDMSAIDFLRNIGKHFPVNMMLAKDSVASRLEGGISFTEFSYMLLQGYDFYELNKQYGCQLQVGGSDQWGNITAGVELLRRMGSKTVMGLTCPLITKSDGTKFGKTAGKAIWLDRKLTSPYEFYQFWITSEDSKVIDYLNVFSFLSRGEIQKLSKSLETDPHKREAQEALAVHMTDMVHGEKETQKSRKISQALFYGEFSKLTNEELEIGFSGVANYQIDDTQLSLVEVLVASQVCSSKRQAREDLRSGAIYINGSRHTDIQTDLGSVQLLANEFIIVRRGKRKYTLLRKNKN